MPTADRDARSAGFSPEIALTKADCAGGLGWARKRAAQLGITIVLIHSPDWSRQPAPFTVELAAARLGLSNRLLLDPGHHSLARLSRFTLATRASALPSELGRSLALGLSEYAHLARMCRQDPADRPIPRVGEPSSVLALWLDLDRREGVGGAVTHLSGVLGGFRAAGLRVTLLAPQEPPVQIASAIDEFVALPPLPRHARTTVGIAQIAVNRVARDVGSTLAATVRPSFIYQRYEALGTCGVELAHRLGVPIVVEWNASAVWVHTHWAPVHRPRRLIAPMMAAAERYVATRADILAAVSDNAAQMAIEAGAADCRLQVVPNAVDFDSVRSYAESAGPDPDPRLVGWVGSFGPWHGAEVLVRAIGLLPDEVRALMIGDGVRRSTCERLARELGVWQRIEWTGALPHSDTVKRLASCAVLASPHVILDDETPFFGSPTKIFEYMAIGRPIVASALAQIEEVLEEGVTAKLVPPGDPYALARATWQLMRDPELATSIGAAARSRVGEQHTWEERARTILSRIAD